MPMPIQTSRQAAKRKQILEAARKLFFTRGYAGTSMDLVTAEAGVSKQTLYRYYATKESLFSDLLNEVILELTEEKQPSLTSLPVPESREQLYGILLMMSQVIAQKLSNPLYVSILRIVFSESARFPEISESFRQTIPRSVGILADLLRSSSRSGLVKLADEDVEMSINMFIGPFISHSVFSGLGGGESSPQPLPLPALEQICRLYVNAIT